jgi:tetraacyldisaccharide-1-P 4'-kinase
LHQLAKESGATALITTAKDAVKLKGLTFALPCYVLEIEIAIDDAEGFLTQIRRILLIDRGCWRS